jgi:hypothetical protein
LPLVMESYSSWHEARMASMQRAQDFFNGPSGRQHAFAIGALSLVVGFTGNPLLSMMGFLTSLMILMNGARAAPIVASLALMTAVFAFLQLFLACGMFVALLSSTPEGFCSRATSLSHYSQPPSTPTRELAYPWNSTTTALVAQEGSSVRENNVRHYAAFRTWLTKPPLPCAPLPVLHWRRAITGPRQPVADSHSRSVPRAQSTPRWPRARWPEPLSPAENRRFASCRVQCKTSPAARTRACS